MVIPTQVLARTDPGLEELMVALAAGIAGAYVQMRKEEASLLPGVAIGVSLVPSLAAAGILLNFGELADAWEAALLSLTNLAAIVLAACGVFYTMGMRLAMRDKGFVTGFGLGAIATLAAVAILSIERARKESSVSDAANTIRPGRQGKGRNASDSYRAGEESLDFAGSSSLAFADAKDKPILNR